MRRKSTAGACSPYKDASGVRLVSRNGRDLTRRFPELAAAVAALDAPARRRDRSAPAAPGTPARRQRARGWPQGLERWLRTLGFLTSVH
jgi:hypothetical protein